MENTKLYLLKSNIEGQKEFFEDYKEEWNEEKGCFIFKSETINDAWYYPQEFPVEGLMIDDGEVGSNKGNVYIQSFKDLDGYIDLFSYEIEENEEYQNEEERFITYIWPDLLDETSNKELLEDITNETIENAKEKVEEVLDFFFENWNKWLENKEFEKAKEYLVFNCDSINDEKICYGDLDIEKLKTYIKDYSIYFDILEDNNIDLNDFIYDIINFSLYSSSVVEGENEDKETNITFNKVIGRNFETIKVD